MKNQSTTILDCVSVSSKHVRLQDFANQWPDAISDGCWMIRRSALDQILQSFSRNAPKVPAFIKDAMLKPTGTNNAVFDSLCTFDANTAVAVELAPQVVKLNGQKGELMGRFDQVDGSMRLFVNIHFVKLLQDLFPGCDWYATAPLKPVMLVRTNTDKTKELVAFFMPIQCKQDIPGFSAPDQKLGLTNTEILMYAAGWQGGTLTQIAKAIDVDDQTILGASPDELRDLVRKAQALRTYTTAVAS